MKNLILSILFLLLPLQSFALAEGVYTVIVKKQEEKKSSRWSLADWLVTKKKIALMDQWLALNSSTTWFELGKVSKSHDVTYSADVLARLPST